MFKSLNAVFVAAVISVGLSSCLGSDSDATRSASFTGCFAYVENLSDRSISGFSGLSYDVSLNYTKGTAEISINNFKLPDDRSYATVKLTDMEFQINKDGWIEISSASTQAEADGYATPLAFKSVDIRICDRTTSEGRLPGFYARYTVDSEYVVLSASSKQNQFGTTTSSAAGGEKYETTDTDYVLGFDANACTVNILMKNFRFSKDMPAMNFLLEKVPFSVSGTSANFNVSEIIPKVGDTAYPGYTIKNLSGYYDFSSGLVMTFQSDPETLPLDFTVNVNCKYSFTK